MMNYKTKLTRNIAKIIGSLMTIAFSFVAVAYGQNCTQWSGDTIPEGQNSSVTAYSATGAIFPKNCNYDFSTTLTCISGSINGNWQAYPYNSCTNDLTPGIDLAIDESPGLPGQDVGGGLIAQGSSPQISILFKNKGDTIFNQPIPNGGFLSCKRVEQNLEVYASKPITNFVVNPGTKVGINILIQPIFAEALGTKTLLCTLDYTDYSGANNIWSGLFEVVKADRFDLALSKSIEGINQNLDAAEGAKGAQGLQNFLFNKIMNVIVPIIIVLGILLALLGFYTLMFSSDEKAIEEGTRYIIYGVIGIIIIVSAKFIGQNVYNILTVDKIQGSEIAVNLYNNILYPFIKFAIYLVLGAMFVILVSRVITFLFGTDEEAQKKAGTLIAWNIIAMIIIIGAKQIVEAIYGKQEAVVKSITNLGEIGSGILADKNIPILYQVINYALGITSLVILVIIIIQTVKLLMKPDDPAQIKSITTSLLYMFIGILILGAGYLIVNFAIIN